MKKIYILCLLLSLFTAKIQAIHLTLSAETGSVGTQVVVKLTANDLTNIIATQFSINFDPSVLQYVANSKTNLDPLGYTIGTSNTATGQIGGLWIDPALAGVSLANGAELMQITFNIIGGAGTTSRISVGNTPTPFRALDGGLAYTRATSTAGSVAISAVLPIDLQSFTAKWRSPATIELMWQTASETNAAKFDIEQGTNGTTFQTIGEVKAKGSSTTPQYYGFTHDNPTRSINYYRLKMVDVDSKFKYSKTIAVNAEIKQFVVIQKHNNQLIINGLDAEIDVDISVSDVMGRVLFSSKKTTNTEGSLTASMPYLTAGIYIFTALSKQNFQCTKFLWTNDN